MLNILEMVSRKTIWGSVIEAEDIKGTFDLVVFKVILGSFGALRILFINTIFAKHFSAVPFDSLYKFYLLEF